MTKQGEIYSCLICGNRVEIVGSGAGQLVCCGQPMEKLLEKNQDEGQEKHLPQVEKMESDIKVKIGSVPHPMEQKHFIEWIEVEAENLCLRKFLKPGEKPEVEFKNIPNKSQVRAYCNVHGLWKN